jgi:glycosyltransferase involved in cell wall biosynthesis
VSVLFESSHHRCEVSVVIPCLNEAETLAGCIEKAHIAMRDAGIDGEVVVADNGSTDRSPEIAVAFGARLLSIPRKGYGAALMGGFSQAYGRYLIMADGDASYDFAHVPRFVGPLRNGADLVMGNRFKGGIAPGAMPFLHRYLGNPVLSFLGRLIFGAKCGDFYCGMRGLSKEAFEHMHLCTTGMEFASEMVVKATLAGMRVEEVPTTLSPDGRSRSPHLRTWHDGWRGLRFLFLYSPSWLFLYPGLLLMALGLGGSLWLMPHRRYIGAVSFDVDTLVYTLGAILIGFQAIVFAFFAQLYGVMAGLLPRRSWIEKWLPHVSLERGLALGVLLTLGGLVATLYGVHLWGLTGFGELNTAGMLRITLPAACAMLLGAEICFASCFLGVLRLGETESEKG